jgi:hypothetical protein
VTESKNTQKKSRESSRYIKAIELARAGDSEVPFGEAVDMEHERPDFVVRSAADPHRLIGIEHFQVDAGGHRKHGAYQSQYRALESQMKELQNRFVADGSYDQALKSFAKLLGSYQRVHFDCGLDNLVKMFHGTLHNHLSKVVSYRSTVEQLAAREHSSYGGLALFIEVRSDFSDLFLNFPGLVPRRCEQGELPMFIEILALLKEAAARVDWILLSSGTTITDTMNSAQVLDCAHDGEDWSIEPYAHYLCQMHKAPAEEGSWTYERNRDAGTVNFAYPRNERVYTRKQFSHKVKEEACRAIDSIEKGEPFAATLGVQMFLGLYGRYLLDCKVKGRPLTVGVMDRMLGLHRTVLKRN